jgi:hypothetical protein
LQCWVNGAFRDRSLPAGQAMRVRHRGIHHHDADRRRGADRHRLALVCLVSEIVTAVARPSSPRSVADFTRVVEQNWNRTQRTIQELAPAPRPIRRVLVGPGLPLLVRMHPLAGHDLARARGTLLAIAD